MKSGDLSADHRPIAKTPKLLADGKKYNKVVMPPTLKKLMGHIAFGACVGGCVGGSHFLYLL